MIICKVDRHTHTGSEALETIEEEYGDTLYKIRQQDKISGANIVNRQRVRKASKKAEEGGRLFFSFQNENPESRIYILIDIFRRQGHFRWIRQRAIHQYISIRHCGGQETPQLGPIHCQMGFILRGFKERVVG